MPRSFIPPFLLASLSTPALRLAGQAGLIRDGVDAQVIGKLLACLASRAARLTATSVFPVRLVLAFVSALALIFLSRRVRSTYGARIAKYTLVLSATQFHVPFWAGRTVPNMLAFPLGALLPASFRCRTLHRLTTVFLAAVQIAMGLFISPPVLQALAKPRFATRRNTLLGFAILTFAALVIRLELLALLVPFALENLLQGSVGFVELAGTGIVATAASLGESAVLFSRCAHSVLTRPAHSYERGGRLSSLAEFDMAVAGRTRVLVQRRRREILRLGCKSQTAPHFRHSASSSF